MQKINLIMYSLIFIDFSMGIYAMQEAPISKRTFPKPLPRELTKEEKIDQQILMATFRKDLIVKLKALNRDEQYVQSEDEPVRPLAIPNVDPRDLKDKITTEELSFPCAQYEMTGELRAEINADKRYTKSLTDIDVILRELSKPSSALQNTTPAPAAVSCQTPHSVGIVTMHPARVDVAPFIQEVFDQVKVVSKLAERFDSSNPTFDENFSFVLEQLDKNTDKLAEILEQKSQHEKIPVLKRLKDFVASTQVAITEQNDPAVTRMTEFRAYKASLGSLHDTLKMQ